MGRELFECEAVFRCSIDELDRIVREESGFSVVEALCGKGAAAELASIDVIQPTIVVGGVVPPQHCDAFYAAGATAIFPPGSVVADTVQQVLELLERRLGHSPGERL